MIDMNKKYRTRSGIPVRILCTDAKGAYPVCALVTHGNSDIVGAFTAEGHYINSNNRSKRDLIEVSPYEDFKIDDQVMVSSYTSPEMWQKRYFAGISEQGLPRTWSAGATSWTTTVKTMWTNCRRPTAEELK